MPAPLYRRQSEALAVTYANVENHALSQGEALIGTPGSISERVNASGARFYARQYYDHDRVKRSQYIAAAEARDAQARVAEWRQRIDEANDLLVSVRLLAREGFAVVTPKHFAAIATLGNYGLFEAGAVLVGSHAMGVIGNRLGIQTATFATEDLDVARPGKLALRNVPEGGLLQVLRDSGINFTDVPPLDPRDPSTNATALPYLRYLIGDTQRGAALSSHGVCTVRVPLAERFALHKLIVARLRSGGSAKSSKDLAHAATLIAALAELQPGALETAYEKTPVSCRKHIRKSAQMILGSLEAHPPAVEVVASWM